MRLLLTGDYRAAEFCAAVAEMRAACEVVEQSGLAQAANWLIAEQPAVDLMVVAQARPGQFTVAEIEALRRAAPLAPLLALVGSWCEGEPRSGSPLPAVVRIYWHQWTSRFPREIRRLGRGELSTWNQPLTATPEERLLWSSGAADEGLAGVVALLSDSPEMAEWLSAACYQAGMATIVFHDLPGSHVEGADVVLWDAGLARPLLADRFARLAAAFFNLPIIVLLDFPRSSDVQQLMDAGAAAVMAKPVLLADLRWQLSQFSIED